MLAFEPVTLAIQMRAIGQYSVLAWYSCLLAWYACIQASSNFRSCTIQLKVFSCTFLWGCFVVVLLYCNIVQREVWQMSNFQVDILEIEGLM